MNKKIPFEAAALLFFTFLLIWGALFAAVMYGDEVGSDGARRVACETALNAGICIAIETFGILIMSTYWQKPRRPLPQVWVSNRSVKLLGPPTS